MERSHPASWPRSLINWTGIWGIACLVFASRNALRYVMRGQPIDWFASFMISSRGRIAFVALSDIGGSRNYVRIRTEGSWHTVREPLTMFASRLDPLQFVRVSRSCIVNLDRVRRQPNGQYVVMLDDGQRLVASRRYGAKLALAGEPHTDGIA